MLYELWLSAKLTTYKRLLKGYLGKKPRFSQAWVTPIGSPLFLRGWDLLFHRKYFPEINEGALSIADDNLTPEYN